MLAFLLGGGGFRVNGIFVIYLPGIEENLSLNMSALWVTIKVALTQCLIPDRSLTCPDYWISPLAVDSHLVILLECDQSN